MDNPPKRRSKKSPSKASEAPEPVDPKKGIRGIELIEVERAAGDLRAGFPVVITDATESMLALPVETMSRDAVAGALASAKRAAPRLLLTPERARALKIRLYTPEVLAVAVDAKVEAIFALRELADPAHDLSNPLRGPFYAQREPVPKVSTSALRLMKIANLLPAAIGWIFDQRTGTQVAKKLGLLTVNANRIGAYQSRASSLLQLSAKANLPLADAQNTRILAFRPPSGSREHLVLLIGNPSPDAAPLVRIHSECFTGDLLGSLKCDCGDQLRGAIKRMSADPAGGVLLYLAQEGRGIGLVNKLRAYDLQDQGFDTVDANTRLGFEPDERQFSVAIEILNQLGFSAIRLLTNNPGKIGALTDGGIQVVERVPHAFAANPHNAEYLKVKARKSGHLL